MSDAISTRMGDGERITMPASELRDEILAGTEDASEKGQVPQLAEGEQEELFEILAHPTRMVSV
ncbi:MAG: [dimethylamine--corrinoid protein] Co-methyltransferase, partial [Gemmatimonadetes bacterium]|nr:[dimethylamine--corrinoid protein] Co-methyltransferase [Gemmatimonadota bacterium]